MANKTPAPKLMATIGSGKPGFSPGYLTRHPAATRGHTTRRNRTANLY